MLEFKNVLVIGNGRSRANYKIENHAYSMSIGCNGIWHEYIPDRIVMVDQEPIKEFVNDSELDAYGLLIIPTIEDTRDLYHHNSGSVAVKHASKYSKNVDIIGFDSCLNTNANNGSNLYSYGGQPSSSTNFYVGLNFFVCSLIGIMRNNPDVTYNIIFPIEYSVSEQFVLAMPNNCNILYRSTLPHQYNIPIVTSTEPIPCSSHDMNAVIFKCVQAVRNAMNFENKENANELFGNLAHN